MGGVVGLFHLGVFDEEGAAKADGEHAEQISEHGNRKEAAEDHAEEATAERGPSGRL